MSKRNANATVTADVAPYIRAIRQGRETHEMRRARICIQRGTSFLDFDLAYLFGYEPESWDGMWKLRRNRPIIQLSKNWAIAAEVVEQPGTHTCERTRTGRQKIRYRLVKARDAR